jgi:hypothetical protein
MLPKLLLLAIAIVAVWYAIKFLNRPRTTPSTPAIESTEKCRRCGVYVATVNAAACGRDACPYPSLGKPGSP